MSDAPHQPDAGIVPADGAPDAGSIAALQAQIAYYKIRLDELAGQTIKADVQISRTTRELRQRRQGFAILSELHRQITTDLTSQQLYQRILEALLYSLKMDRSVVLERDGDSALARPVAWSGFESTVEPVVRAASEPSAPPLELPPDLLRADGSILATKTAAVTPFITAARERLGMAFFVALPITSGDRIIAVLLSGRQREMKPFSPPLDEQDVHTLASIAGFLGAALTNATLFDNQKRMTDSFRRFVPREFLELLGRRSMVDVVLGDQTQRTMSILFSDIRSFTSISEHMSPNENFDFINRYLEFVAPAVLENGGFIDKYIGDAIMALFPGDADSALRGAIGLHAALARFNTEWTSAGHAPLAIGAGVHTGPLMLGTIGFRERMDTTVIADAVNLAARMEGLTKQYGAGVLISGETKSAFTSPQSFSMRIVDRVMVKGKKKIVDIIECFDGDSPATLACKRSSLSAFESALADYTAGRFSVAAAAFEAVSAAACGVTGSPDTAADLLSRRSRMLAGKPVPADWQGVVAMEK
jgi:class 3 adenylate cyclase